jgi:hypothetical protein
LLGFNVSHHAATSAHAPKMIPRFSSFPRTKMTIASSAITNKIAANAPPFGKSK